MPGENSRLKRKSGDEVFGDLAGELINVAGNSSESIGGALVAMAVAAGVLYGGYHAAKVVKKQIGQRRRKGDPPVN